MTFVVLYMNNGKSSYQDVDEELGMEFDTLEEVKYKQYTGDSVKGSEVQYCIKNYPELVIKVTTNNSISTSGSNQSVITSFTDDDIYDATKAGMQAWSKMTDRDSKYYINPNAEFAGKLIRNDDNVITGLEFRQQNYLNIDKVTGDTYSEVPAKETSSSISDGIKSWSEIKKFLLEDVNNSYVNYSVTVRVSGGSYFYSYRNPYLNEEICSDDTLFLATVNRSLNNSVYVELVEQTSESASAIAVVFEKFRTDADNKVMLIPGSTVLELLSEYSQNSPFKMNLQTYTNKDNSTVTYWNQNPFLTNDPSVMGYVDKNATYFVRLDGSYSVENDLRDMQISFTNSNISFKEYSIAEVTSIFGKITDDTGSDMIQLLDSKTGDTIELDKLATMGYVAFKPSKVDFRSGTNIAYSITLVGVSPE